MSEPGSVDDRRSAATPVGGAAGDTVLTEWHGAVLVLTLNRPEVHNALDGGMLLRLRELVEQAARDDGTRAVVLTGAGSKAFSAGADLAELRDMDADRAREVLQHGQDAIRAIERAPVPVISAVNGVALGGGFEVVLAGTFAVLSTRASLGLPEAGLGLIPGYGGTQRLPRALGGAAARYLMLTGERLAAGRAYELGLTPVPPVEPEELLDRALQIAGTIAARGPQAVRAILRAVDRGLDCALDAGLAMETGLAALAVAGAEADEGIAAFLERRTPSFAGVTGP